MFCILAQYGVRPDRYICPESELSEMYGTPCPDDGESRCYIRFSTNEDVETGPGVEFLYVPYGGKGRAKNLLLTPRRFWPRLEPGSVVTPTEDSDMDAKLGTDVVDTRIMNEAGFYVGCSPRHSPNPVHVLAMEAEYRVGKAMYEKMSGKEGRFMIACHTPMGDNYRWMSKYEGLDYSDMTFVVSERAKDLPSMLGVKGMYMTRGEQKCLRQYLSMTYFEDTRFVTIPFKPLYPGIMVNSDIRVAMYTGATRRLGDPALSIVGPVDEDMLLKRARAEAPSQILLNPYGNSINHRSKAETDNVYEVMRQLTERFQEKGCRVYTNTPSDEQEALPGTERYRGDIVETMAGSSGFDMVITAFTGFMEAMMHTNCNLVVLSYSDNDSRRSFSKSLGHDNYWEFNVLENDPGSLVSRIIDAYDETCSPKPFYRPVEHILSLDEAVSLFALEEIDPDKLDLLVSVLSRREIDRLLDEGTNDPMLCCIVARALEQDVDTKGSGRRALAWYRKARRLGKAPVFKMIVDLKARLASESR